MSPLDRLCIDTIRMLSADAVQRARSGHPGMPMGAAAIAYVLWTSDLRHHPRHPNWPDRDRFILSAGHGSMLLYALLHLSGYDLSLDDLRAFRQWGSRTPGHPERGVTPGVEVTTGPLGQGFANGVGMALAERYLATRFNRAEAAIVDHYTYGIVSDGDLMEGISHEAASLAGHLKLGKLIYLYDDNRITIEGATSLACSDDVRGRFESYGWHVQEIDGNDLEQVRAALQAARAEGGRPSLIAARTHIGHGSPHRQDTARAHGEPLGEEELRLTKEALGWPLEPAFHVPDEVRAHFARALERGEALEREWEARRAAHARAYPAEHAEYERWMAGALPAGWDRGLADLIAEVEKQPQATRAVSGMALNALASGLGNLVGGSADLGPSNNTAIRDAGAFAPGRVEGPNLHFGVREHAMAGIANGLALHGGLRPYCGTFLVFSDYLRPSIRIAALTRAPVIYIFTHDSIGVGEDGPTHQPIEHLAALRAIPGLTVLRPADARETVQAWQVALQRGGPVALILTRQKLPVLSRARMRLPAAGSADAASPLARGGYVLSEAASGAEPALILIATGSEVARCVEAQAKLEADGVAVRVVSLPSWELFEEQPAAYREFVLPARVSRRLAVEAGVPLGWERYASTVIGMTRFGASAPEAVLFEQFGLTADAIADRALVLLGRGVPRSAGA